jgi:glycosyltransferase involved in cell wall biosynthesis
MSAKVDSACRAESGSARQAGPTPAGPRIVLATRRYWPQVGSTETIVASLALALKRLGARPLVLTAQVERSWPAEVLHREIPIVRLPYSPSRWWGSYRYLGALAKWFRAKRGEVDIVYVCGLRFDAYTILGEHAGSGVPVVLRAERGGEEGDCRWQRRARFGARVRRRCLTADGIVAPSEFIASELREAGYPEDRVQVIPSGVAMPEEPRAGRRTAAREFFAAAHPILSVAEHAPLVVCVGRFVPGSGYPELVEAWPAVQRRWPAAKLWLIGQGPDAEGIWRRIKRGELENDVIMTGLFDHLEDVFHAADLFVKPSRIDGSTLSLLEAMAAGVSIVATDLPTAREALGSTEQGLLVPAGNVPALSGAMIQLLADRPLGERLADAARRRVADHFTLERMAVAHLELFERLLASGRVAGGGAGRQA